MGSGSGAHLSGHSQRVAYTGLGFPIQRLMVERRNVFVVIECHSKYLITFHLILSLDVNVLLRGYFPPTSLGRNGQLGFPEIG
jgi:hypothetical protein